MFAGKDFLKMKPPPGYKPGIGRGAVPFTTNAERGGGSSAAASNFPHASANKRQKSLTSSAESNGERFADAEDEAAGEIWEAIEARRRRRRKRNPSKQDATASTEPASTSLPSASAAGIESNSRTELANISIEEWAQIPEAVDTTRANKRLRESEQKTRRTYAAPLDSTGANSSSDHNDTNSSLQDAMRQRPLLEQMIKQQPHNPEGYLRLCRLEQDALHMKQARQIAERGTQRIPSNKDLWIASIELQPQLTRAREISAKACKSLPQCEDLWLKAVELEPTQVLKRQTVHEALLACPNGERLWLAAADLESDLETRKKVLLTAADFTNTSNIWLALQRVDPAGNYLASAREKFNKDRNVWYASVLHDAALISEAVDALPRQDWLDFLANNRPPREIVGPLVRALNLSLVEARGLPKNLHVYAAMDPSEELYLQWAAEEADDGFSALNVLRTAIECFPSSDRLLIEFASRIARIARNANDNITPESEAWAQELMSKNTTASISALSIVAELLLSLRQYEQTLAWLEPRKHETVKLWLYYIEAAKNTGSKNLLDLLQTGVEKWPTSAELYLLLAKHNAPGQAVKILKDGLGHVQGENQAKLLNELALLEPSMPRRRAMIAQALAKYPQSGSLWLTRIQLERRDNKPVTHVLAEATRRCPHYAPIWLEDLLVTPISQRKRRLAEAVRQSGGDKQVLVYGAMYFAANNRMDTAREWLRRAGKDETSLTPNPFQSTAKVQPKDI